MLARLDPTLLETHGWVFVEQGDNPVPETAFAIVREQESTTLIVPADEYDASPVFARITLRVYSDLEDVGLTAAVSTALAKEEIPCNVIAGLRHDHVFVPWDQRHSALAILKALFEDARR